MAVVTWIKIHGGEQSVGCIRLWRHRYTGEELLIEPKEIAGRKRFVVSCNGDVISRHFRVFYAMKSAKSFMEKEKYLAVSSRVQ